MNTLKIKAKVEYSEAHGEYLLTSEKSNSNCGLCTKVYERAFGKTAVGEVTFILEKLKSKCKDYSLKFRIDDEACLEFYDGEDWEYGKTLGLLDYAIDAKHLTEWAGDNVFSITVEMSK
jgi:hypothetical protein